MVVDTEEETMVVVLATTVVGWVTWPRRRRQFIFFSAANCFFLIETNILSSSRSSGACYSCGGNEPYGQGLQPRRTQMWRHARRWWWQRIRYNYGDSGHFTRDF
ncbi:hypothetical protein HN51_017154 [Arachis hypogaea]